LAEKKWQDKPHLLNVDDEDDEDYVDYRSPPSAADRERQHDEAVYDRETDSWS